MGREEKMEKRMDEIEKIIKEKQENGSYFLTDDMKELDEQRKELIETIADREETRQILIELEQIEKDLDDLEEEINDLSGAYFIPEDITKEKEEKENRKKELEEKLKNKKVNTKSKDLKEIKVSRTPNNPKGPKGPNDPDGPNDSRGQKGRSDPKSPNDSKPSIWKRVGAYIKKQWKKIALAFGVGVAALGPGAIVNSEEITHQGEKIEEREVTETKTIEEEIQPSEIVDNLKVGDIVTLKGNSDLFYTSNLDTPMAIIENLTKSGAAFKVMTTKIVEDKIHFSLVVDGSEPVDLTVGGTSELLEKGELDNLPDELKQKLGTDIGWMTKENAKDCIVPQTRMVEKEVKTTKQVKVPYERITEKKTIYSINKEDGKQVESPDQTLVETEKVQESDDNRYVAVEALEKGEEVEIRKWI